MAIVPCTVVMFFALLLLSVNTRAATLKEFEEDLREWRRGAREFYLRGRTAQDDIAAESDEGNADGRGKNDISSRINFPLRFSDEKSPPILSKFLRGPWNSREDESDSANARSPSDAQYASAKGSRPISLTDACQSDSNKLCSGSDPFAARYCLLAQSRSPNLLSPLCKQYLMASSACIRDLRSRGLCVRISSSFAKFSALNDCFAKNANNELLSRDCTDTPFWEYYRRGDGA